VADTTVELGGDIYELHVEDGDNKHMYGVCENPVSRQLGFSASAWVGVKGGKG
jgi:hypothetical protein